MAVPALGDGGGQTATFALFGRRRGNDALQLGSGRRTTWSLWESAVGVLSHMEAIEVLPLK